MDMRAFNKNYTRKLFGEKLTECMKQKQISQTVLATLLQTSQQTVSRWCKGICEPDYDTLKLLSFILDEPLDELLFMDYKKLQNYYRGIIENIVANTKAFRKEQQKYQNMLIKREITEEVCHKLEITLLSELVKEFCEKNKIVF